MRTALLVLGGILVGILIVVVAFCGTVILVNIVLLRHEGDGQAGLGALIYGVVAGVPAALVAGYLWLSFCLDQFVKNGILPGAASQKRRGA